MQEEDLYYYYEIREEDVGRYGFTKKSIIYRRGKPTIKVPVKSEEQLEALKNEFSTGAKREARDNRCLIPGKNGNLIKCNKSCKDCTKKHKFIAELEAMMLLSDIEDVLATEDEEFSRVDERATLESIIDEIQTTSPTYARILRLRLRGLTIRTIARIEGKAPSSIAETLKNAIKLARKIFLKDM